jgi:hypothetical protein
MGSFRIKKDQTISYPRHSGFFNIRDRHRPLNEVGEHELSSIQIRQEDAAKMSGLITTFNQQHLAGARNARDAFEIIAGCMGIGPVDPGKLRLYPSLAGGQGQEAHPWLVRAFAVLGVVNSHKEIPLDPGQSTEIRKSGNFWPWRVRACRSVDIRARMS